MMATAAAAPLSPTAQRYWEAVRTNPRDFSSWSVLLQLIDRENDIEAIRKAYDGFLAEFPLCYVYWKKYADHELAHHQPSRCKEVYERGVAAIPHCVELWSYYVSHTVEKAAGNVEEIESVFERAVAAVGTDFQAHQVWDKFLAFESTRQDLHRVSQLYRCILGIPLDQITSYWEKFKALCGSHRASELLSEEELRALPAVDGVPAGDANQALLRSQEAVYQATLDEVNKRRPFESIVKQRPYFHVKPLEDHHLQNWRAYLSFEEGEGNHKRIVKLYERCLIACANYSEFWIRYANYLESLDVAQARAVLERAASVFLKQNADVRLELAALEEACGNKPRARQLYSECAALAPSNVETAMRHASFEQRHGGFAEAEAVFERARRAVAPSTEGGDAVAYAFLSIKHAQLVAGQHRDSGRAQARRILDEAVQHAPRGQAAVARVRRAGADSPGNLAARGSGPLPSGVRAGRGPRHRGTL